MKTVLRSAVGLGATLLLLGAPSAFGQEDLAPGAVPLREGDVIPFEQLTKIRRFLPEPFWANRDFFFYEGMQLEIGPRQRDYTPPQVYREATERHHQTVRLGPDGSLEGYRAGQPFPMDAIDCRADPDAGTKIAWNFVRRWEGGGGKASFYYSYWDRGEELPLYYEGHAQGVSLAFRPEPQYDKNEGDVFRGEKRYVGAGPTVEAPFDARGIMVLTYRYKSSYGPMASAKNDDTWVYVPTLRRVRRISSAQRTDAVSGTDFTFDDLFSFNGVVPQYTWSCLEEREILAPINTKVRAYPYNRDHNFGPFGLSFADDRWEQREAVKIRFEPRNANHPYLYKDIWIDKQTLEPLYSFAYDRKGELWKVIWHNHRWSEDDFPEYAGWENVPRPRDLAVVSDIIANVQTGTGNRIEVWDRNGTPLKSKGRMRRFLDVGRLTKGR
ncbi:MAG: DUF1329 domain-containing protein [Proteobacteria bacterium]|nr:DUF1329 domain-containing protein [Pseudomonadota bacterium]